MAKERTVRRSSGILLDSSPEQGGQERALCNVLQSLTAVTRAISINLRNVNEDLERILMDKTDIEELENMLKSLTVQND